MLLDLLLDLLLCRLEASLFLEVIAGGLELRLDDAEVVEDDVFNLCSHAHLLDVLKIEGTSVLKII